MAKSLNLKGQKFGLLTVTDQYKRCNKFRHWQCQCECGKFVWVRTSHLVSGATKTCGCGKDGSRTITHGMSKHRVYKIWAGMKKRCTNPLSISYPRYGGSGINVCNRWLTFENFIADMGIPKETDSIDRIDNSKGYFPGNCRWASRRVQSENRKNSVTISHNGETMVLKQWAKKIGIPYKVLHKRIRFYGWPIERAFNEPVGHYHRTRNM